MGGRTLFITGASGYVGRRLLASIDPRKFNAIYRLVRSTPGPQAPGQDVKGDLLAPSTYQRALAACDTVIHLAAITGKNKPVEYFRVNRDGTRALVEACQGTGVRDFLHISTIAVKYRDLADYPYAQAKLEAEEIVRSSGLRYTIVRPTMIFGPRAPVLTNLAKLALAPVVPIFGSGRAKVQPIHVDDLVTLILSLVDADDFRGEVIEAGGPEILAIADLLLRIRRVCGGKAGLLVHLPMRIIEPALRLAEPLLPISAGQLKALMSDGVASGGSSPGKTTIAESLQVSFASEATERLKRECRTYARYLIGCEPGDRILTKYEEFHRTEPQPGLRENAPFDRVLVRVSARGPLLARLADAYSSRFYRASALRRKLVLVLALLECVQPSAKYLDSPGIRGAAGTWTGLAASASGDALALAFSVLVFAPFHLACRWRRTE